MREMAHTDGGCRALQLLLGDKEGALRVLDALRGCVSPLARSPHGNYVLQGAVKELPLAQTQFIAEEVETDWKTIATDRHGCRVVCRLVEALWACGERGPAPEAHCRLKARLLAEVETLSWHRFSRYVLDTIFVSGGAGWRAATEELKRAPAAYLGISLKNPCRFYEHALRAASPDSARHLAQAVFDVDPPRGGRTEETQYRYLREAAQEAVEAHGGA